MNRRGIEQFFRFVDRRLKTPVRVVLTGGAVASLYGGTRVTLDIDFEVHPQDRDWGQVQKVMEEVSQETGITPQFSSDIDRWSSIALPERKSRLFKKIGKVEVRILDPAVWAIGKLTRYLPSDVEDLVTVLKSAHANPEHSVRLWGKALGVSPPASAQHSFRRHVTYFLDLYAKEIFGHGKSPEKLKDIFLESARRAASRRHSFRGRRS